MSTLDLTAEAPARPPLGRLRPLVLLAADAGVVAALWFGATHVVAPAAGLLHVPQWSVAILTGIAAGVGGTVLAVRLHRRA
jgi:hypothetical protein